MTGDIVDSNSAMIAQELLPLGLTVSRKVAIADDLDVLVNEIQYMSQNADILIINGGLGPTIDDLTAKALALASEVELVQNNDALTHLQHWGEQRGVSLNDANLKQTFLPQHSTVIANPVGSAVGIATTLNQCAIYCTPGVPSELAIMMKEQITALLNNELSGLPQYKVERYLVFGIGESSLQQLIIGTYPQWPDEVLLGFRAASPFLEVKLTIKETSHQALLTQWQQNICQLLGDHILADLSGGVVSLAELVINELQQRNQTITLAESCTGGMIASEITRVSGASTVFEAGFVTYSNKMKEHMIGVSEQTLNNHGAVSEEVVYEMAQGALANSNADYVIAVSGIAGPNGGTTDKPVGSVWIAWGNNTQIHRHYFCIKGNRTYFQKVVTMRALDLIRRLLIESKQVPNYIA